MGIQTTIEITREQAQEKYTKLLWDHADAIKHMPKELLEDLIDEEFYNYIITD